MPKKKEVTEEGKLREEIKRLHDNAESYRKAWKAAERLIDRKEAKEATEGPLCPMNPPYICQRERCAWWVYDRPGLCAVLAIAIREGNLS